MRQGCPCVPRDREGKLNRILLTFGSGKSTLGLEHGCASCSELFHLATLMLWRKRFYRSPLTLSCFLELGVKFGQSHRRPSFGGCTELQVLIAILLAKS